MDFKLAIERNRAPLLVEVLKLFAMIGLTEGATIERISRPLHRQVMGILRKAESAVRRLIVAAARDIVLEPEEPRPPRPRAKTSDKSKDKAEGEVKEKRKRRPLFNLFDQLKRFGRRFKKKRRGPEPHVHSIESFFQQKDAEIAAAQAKQQVVDDGMVNAAPLIRRLMACADALQDIPGHAMRLARWLARDKEDRRPERWSPLRPGRPPGFRQKAKHVVDEILKECHWLAQLGNRPLDDTS
jgi:hypothetical protein